MPESNSRNPDPRPAALLRVARDTLGITLKEVGAAVGRSWSTINNCELGEYALSPVAEERVIRYYIAQFAACGTRVEAIPDGAGLADLRLVLAQVLFTVQSEGLLAQSAGLEQAAVGLGQGAFDFTELVLGTTLRNRGRGRGRIPNKLLQWIAETKQAKAAVNE